MIIFHTCLLTKYGTTGPCQISTASKATSFKESK